MIDEEFGNGTAYCNLSYGSAPESTGSCQSEGHAHEPRSFERSQGLGSHKIWDAKLDETFGY